ncbi:MAG: hypothetical protein A2790_10400 [Phenylobacterium sp. RIFCSPHIGHO2_01_FULL_69_31]|uniref:HvfC/BufC family peptide modification chaperone n=1 Tax=Phenylobacterium sp. RIFCSPHIGHO2_01_FULL_69_31 TaxID=1801944 RepID=UPI0008C140F1|nr:putative DNA-binding domain-containing protein [Phenylobacterium sp. RIFCSPHIGHO2_01_FULL_69_31]OHB31058.1 MAG: hypothetical protein A2790_10400 [Phenylobacterium sp. RIFCSPHIGHO2_01_FULL_69_31]
MRDAFHERFLAAVAGDAAALAPWCAPNAAEAGLSVYRNTVGKGCADALAAQFPTVERVVGPAWLAAAATAHATACPPRTASLLAYGEAFPTWLADFPPAADMPYLAGLAQLDWLWTCAHLAADARPLAPEAAAALSPAAFSTHALVLHPATRFADFEDGTPSLWRALQSPDAPPKTLELNDAPEGLLLVRPGLDIRHQLIGPGELMFLAASSAGASLLEAAMAALAAEPGLDLSTAFAGLVAAGAFTALRKHP